MADPPTSEYLGSLFDKYNVDGNTHLLIVYAPPDGRVMPRPVGKDETVNAKLVAANKDGLTVTEVYSYALPREAQLNEFRAWHLD